MVEQSYDENRHFFTSDRVRTYRLLQSKFINQLQVMGEECANAIGHNFYHASQIIPTVQGFNPTWVNDLAVSASMKSCYLALLRLCHYKAPPARLKLSQYRCMTCDPVQYIEKVQPNAGVGS